MSDDTVPDTERYPNGWQMQRFADMQMFRDGTFPSSSGHVATTTLLADMQTFVLPDVLEDLSASLLIFATKHGRFLRDVDKRGIGTLSFVRASSEPVMPRRR